MEQLQGRSMCWVITLKPSFCSGEPFIHRQILSLGQVIWIRDRSCASSSLAVAYVYFEGTGKFTHSFSTSLLQRYDYQSFFWVKPFPGKSLVLGRSRDG